MTDSATPIEQMQATQRRREDRRAFFRTALGVAAAGGAMALASHAEAQTIGDPDILNFALNLEYLEAQFYAYAATGVGLAGSQLTGTGTLGAVNATGAHQVAFADPIIARMAQEIAADEAAHVAFLRSQLGSAAVAMPALDLSVSPTSAFAKVAQAASIVPAGTAFDPYAGDDNFLLAAFIFEDVGVTAYKGASPLITNKTYLEAAAGILAVEAYHAATIRVQLYNRGQSIPNDITYAQGIATARDSLDGGTVLDPGIMPTTTTVTNADGSTTTTITSMIVPADANAVAFSRTTGQVLNIAYITSAAATAGGFFPAGVNGTIATSTAE